MKAETRGRLSAVELRPGVFSAEAQLSPISFITPSVWSVFIVLTVVYIEYIYI